MNAIPRPIHFCWICGKAVDLRDCNFDEHGSAVHENCYIAKIALDGITSRETEQATDLLSRSADNEWKSQELIQQTRKLLAQSQAIVTKKYRCPWD